MRAKLSPDTNLDCFVFELGDSVSSLMITTLIFKKKKNGFCFGDWASRSMRMPIKEGPRTLCGVPVEQRPRPSTLWPSSAQSSQASCILGSAHTAGSSGPGVLPFSARRSRMCPSAPLLTPRLAALRARPGGGPDSPSHAEFAWQVHAVPAVRGRRLWHRSWAPSPGPHQGRSSMEKLLRGDRVRRDPRRSFHPVRSPHS